MTGRERDSYSGYAVLWQHKATNSVWGVERAFLGEVTFALEG